MAKSLDDMIDVGTAALGIPVASEWKAEIRTQLEVSLKLGALAAEFPLPDDEEPAPVFKA